MPKGQKTKARDWLPLIEDWQQSGLSKKDFCLGQNICYKNFTRWYSRLTRPKKMEHKVASTKLLPAVSPLFVPVEIKSTEGLNASAKPWILVLNKQIQLQIPAESVNEFLLNMLIKLVGTLSC